MEGEDGGDAGEQVEQRIYAAADADAPSVCVF